MIGRIFLVLVLLAVSLYVVKYLRTKLDDAQKPNDKDTKENQITKNKMVKCQSCGLHVPEREAIKQGDNVFCSLEHAKQEQ